MEEKIVGGYVRVSHEEAALNGLSLESQQRDIEAYCKMKGYRLQKFYIDRGITARKDLDKREAFMEMMQDVKNGKINHIVVIRLDRFFRNVYHYHKMMNEYLNPAGCGWSAVKEEYDTTTTNGRLMINLRLSIAEQEADIDSDRIKDVFSNRIRQGYVVYGKPTYGYRITDDKRYEINEEEAEIVRYIFREYVKTHSARKIILNIRQDKGINFNYDKIKKILKSEFYIGKYRDNDHFCDPIIDEKTFQYVQDNLGKNIRYIPTERTYLFKGILKCADCGGSMGGTTPSHYKKNYYKCVRAFRHDCENRHITLECIVEDYLLENIEKKMREYVAEVEKQNAERKVRKGNRKEIEAKISRLSDLFVNGFISLEDLKAKKAKLESEIIEDEEPVKDVSKIKDLIDSNAFSMYHDLTQEEKQRFWRSIIKEIYVNYHTVTKIVFL